jgi:hypothetical protein
LPAVRSSFKAHAVSLCQLGRSTTALFAVGATHSSRHEYGSKMS